jgi:hypothetical protein
VTREEAREELLRRYSAGRLRGVTLNGEPAAITGFRNDFAHIRQVKTGLGCEWSWPTVLHVVRTKGGAFTT